MHSRSTASAKDETAAWLLWYISQLTLETEQAEGVEAQEGTGTDE